ncbi:MAG: CRISPR-associated endonuclease Cas2 [Chloroflexi bacterium]|nr:CRISPR-associated endonuclease Cas2 [Chloroflexota bacterium]MBI5702575.1 CRISPR-associated endonuclease Cas2 [Chloroflexota bacterium]
MPALYLVEQQTKIRIRNRRVQDSVFEAYLNEAELEKLLNKVRKILQEEEDSLRLYALCAACRGRLRVLGQGHLTPPPSTMIV